MAVVNVKIALDAGQFKGQASQISGQVSTIAGTINAKFESMAARVTTFSFAFNQITQVAGRVARALEAPISKFAEFEAAMANVESLGVPNIAELRSEVLQTAEQVAVPLSDLTQGLYDVVSAGVAAESQISFLNITAKAAKAGIAETTDAVNLSSAVVKGFGLEWSETESILDQAFQTVKLGQTNFPQLAANMGQVIPLFSAMKGKTTELFGAFATLTGVTGNTSEVATQLKSIMSELSKPTKELSDAVQKHTGMTVENLVAQEGLAGVLKVLKDETGGSATGMNKLFGSVEAVTGLLALTTSQFDTFQEKTKAMTESAGAMTEAYNVQAKTIKSQWQLVINKADASLVRIMEALQPVIIGALALAENLLEVDWTPFIVGATTAAAALVGLKIGVFVSSIGTIGPALVFAATAFRAFAVSVTTSIAAIPVVGWVAAGISALTALVTWLALSGDSEADLAKERKKTAQETLNIIDAEKKRIRQAQETNGVTDESTEKLKLLNEQMLAQQKIISDANLVIFQKQMQDAKDDLHDLHQGLIDSFDNTGKVTRSLFQRFGDDVVAMNEHVSNRLAEIGDKLFENKMGYIQLTQDEIEALEDEKNSLKEVQEFLPIAAKAQRDYNLELENRKRLLGGVIVLEKEHGKAVVNAANDIVNSAKAIQSAPILPVVELPEDTLDMPGEVELGKTFETLMQERLDRNQATLDAGLIQEQDFHLRRIELARNNAEQLRQTVGVESQEYLSALADKKQAEQAFDEFKDSLARNESQRQEKQQQQRVALAQQAVSTAAALFGRTKGVLIAQAAADTYAGANRALAAYPPPMSFVMAGLQVAAGLANIAKINASEVESKREGGFLGAGIRTIAAGNFGGGEDRMIIANSGEFIVNRRATAIHRALLEMINSQPENIRRVPSFQDGGFVGGLTPISTNGQGFDFERFIQAVQNIQIVIKSELDAMQFYRQTFPEFQKSEAQRQFV